MTQFTKLNGKRILSLIIVLIMLCGAFSSLSPVFALQQDDVYDIYIFGNMSSGAHEAPLKATGGMLASLGNLTSTRNPKTITCNADGFPAENGFDDPEQAWIMAISTAGYDNITIKDANMRSSGGAPKNFKVQASTDGKTWEDVAECKKLLEASMMNTLENVKLPANCSNQKTLYLKWIPSTRTSANNGSLTSTGSNRFGTTIITATEYRPEGMPRKVVSDTLSGAVPKGQEINLTCEEGSVIKYSINGGAETVLTTNNAKITINDFVGTEKTCIINTKAYNTTSKMDSYVTTLTYTQAAILINSSVPTGRMITEKMPISFVATYAQAKIKYQVTYNAGQPNAHADGWVEYSKELFFTTEKDFPIMIATKADADGGYQESPTIFFLYYYSDNLKDFNNYYGQLHSHTGDSDGTGTVSGAYDYADNIADVDFLAITDHSNYFDSSNDSLDVNTTAEKWIKGLEAANNATDNDPDNDFVALYGYEMTWSGGPGHMNTYNCNGFVSRNSSVYNNKTNDAGLQAYYNLLTTEAMKGSVSAFNHPGKTFGTFSDYAYYNPIYDEMITMIEVGNGEGAVGSGMYFRSYEEYWKALDKGWHLAPTNNGDNHQGKWGNSNTARTVLLSQDLSKEGLYKAMRNMRVYATEEADLQIDYRLNGNAMGSIINEEIENINIRAKIVNPSGTNIKRLSIIVNGGKEIGVVEDVGKSTYDYSYDCVGGEYTYYYLKVELENGRLAVTAPIWIGEVEKIGISDYSASTFMPIKGEEVGLEVTIFNNEKQNLVVDSIEFRKGDYPIGVIGESIVASGEIKTFKLGYVPTFAGETKFEVHVTGHIGDNVRKYFTSFKTTVRDGTKLKTIAFDSAHQNDYVAGNYANSVSNFTELAGNNGSRVVMLKEISELTLSKVDALILTPPSRSNSKKDGDGNPTKLQSYSQSEIDAIDSWLDKDKTIIVCGLADYSDAKTQPDPKYHAAYQMNSILTKIGASTQIRDDEMVDDVKNAGQSYRLRFKNCNTKSKYLKGADVEKQEYSFYSGCSIEVTDDSKVETLVSTWTSTYAFDSDGDGKGGVGKGENPVLTVETLANGATVFTAGTVFVSNFEVSIEMENATTLPYINAVICSNILRHIAPPQFTEISEMKKGLEGEMFTVKGIVTSNASGHDRATAFFDCIYIQDNSGGLNLFPVSGDYAVGDLVMATGKVSSYNGETQMEVTSSEIITREFTMPVAKDMTAEESSLKENVGWLARVEGVVSKVTFKEGLLESFMIDGKAFVWIDGYITTDVDLNWIKNGMTVSAEGLTSMTANTQSGERYISRIRVANRNTIKFVKGALDTPPLEILSTTSDSIVFNMVEGAEYSVDKGKTWQDSNIFNKLDSDTNYVCVIRMKATATQNASAPSELKIVTTDIYEGIGTTGIILIVLASLVVVGGGTTLTLLILKKKGILKGNKI